MQDCSQQKRMEYIQTQSDHAQLLHPLPSFSSSEFQSSLSGGMSSDRGWLQRGTLFTPHAWSEVQHFLPGQGPHFFFSGAQPPSSPTANGFCSPSPVSAPSPSVFCESAGSNSWISWTAGGAPSSSFMVSGLSPLFNSSDMFLIGTHYYTTYTTITRMWYVYSVYNISIESFLRPNGCRSYLLQTDRTLALQKQTTWHQSFCKTTAGDTPDDDGVTAAARCARRRQLSRVTDNTRVCYRVFVCVWVCSW